MREYVLVFLTAAVVSYLLCVFARELAMRLNAVARVRDRDVHAVPIPYFGGVAMLGGLWSGLLLAHHLPFLSLSQPQVFDDARVVLIGGTIICLVGVVDDMIELDALTKLGGQVVAAGYLVLNGVQLYSVRVPGQTGQLTLDPTQAMLFSMLLIVGTVNAINFVDGLDGLAGGMVCIGAIAFFVFSYRLADVNNLTLAITGALLCACLAGACVGFLPHNFYPARIFMGDSGSMLLGLVLSGSALTLTGQFAGVQVSGGITTTLAIMLPILLPISILVVPFVDMVLAVVRRTRRGQMFYQ
ncbi:MAG: MraY family glycosyltransferase, partial [Marmoricola sp.]